VPTREAHNPLLINNRWWILVPDVSLFLYLVSIIGN
jgi:hypothetical protein